MHPCLSCGACCAYFKVAFYWSEADRFAGGTVPAELTEAAGGLRVAMRGTQARPARCTALQGEVGQSVSCNIYAERPSPCRELLPSWQDGKPDDKCDRARLAHGLPVLAPDDFPSPEYPPQPMPPSRRSA